MIRPKNDHCVVVKFISLERFEHSPDLAVHETRAGQITADQVAPLVAFLQPLVANLRQIPVHIPRKTGRVVTVTAKDFWQHTVVVRIKVEPLLRRETRDMREEKADRQKERLAGLGIELLDGPRGDLPVTLVLVLVREHAPVHQLVIPERRRTDQFRRRIRCPAGSRAKFIEFLVRLLSTVATMKNFSRRVGRVAAVLLEILRQRHEIFQLRHRSKPRRQTVNTGRAGSHPGHQACA